MISRKPPSKSNSSLEITQSIHKLSLIEEVQESKLETNLGELEDKSSRHGSDDSQDSREYVVEEKKSKPKQKRKLTQQEKDIVKIIRANK